MGIFNFFKKPVPTEFLHFIYRDAQGEITARTVEPQSADDTYLHALDHTEGGAIRTFRHDRFLETIESPADLPARLKHHLANHPPPRIKSTTRKNKTNSNHLPSICFTGFTATEKTELIQQAEGAGYYVAPAVNASLDYLCGGSRAGPAKLKKSKDLGISIIDADQFKEMAK